MKRAMTFAQYMERMPGGILTAAGRCPVTVCTKALAGKWTMDVLYALCVAGTVRLGRLMRDFPDASKTALVGVLHRLERGGIVSRTVVGEKPLHVEYALTAKGRDLHRVFYEMMNWGFAHEAD